MKGKDLKQIMDRFGLTQQGLADQLGVARNTVIRWANDLEAIPDVIEIAVKSLKLSAKKGKTMPLDLRKRKPGSFGSPAHFGRCDLSRLTFCSGSGNEKGAGDTSVERGEFRPMGFCQLKEVGIRGPRCMMAPIREITG